MSAYPIGVVGESFDNDDGSSRQAEIVRCTAGEAVALERDPENKYDRNCVKVISARGVQIGNISRDDDWICERIDRDAFLDARILSVGKGKRGYGVVLCVRTAEDDEWLSKSLPHPSGQPRGDEPSGCTALFALGVLVPTIMSVLHR